MIYVLAGIALTASAALILIGAVLIHRASVDFNDLEGGGK